MAASLLWNLGPTGSSHSCVPGFLWRALSFKCWVVFHFTVLKHGQWDETHCRNASSPCKVGWAGFCIVYRK